MNYATSVICGTPTPHTSGCGRRGCRQSHWSICSSCRVERGKSATLLHQLPRSVRGRFPGASCYWRCVFAFACAFHLCRSPTRDLEIAAPKKSAYILHIAQLHVCRTSVPFACLRSFVLDLTRGNADTMPTCRPERVVATGVGPRATLVRTNLQAMYPHVKKAWVEEARLTAILGNRASTLKSLRSGVCCYITFIGEHLREARFRVRSVYLACFISFQMHVATRGVPTSRQSSTCC